MLASEIMPGAEPFETGDEASDVGCVLIHGFTGSPAEMRPFGEGLAQASLRCYGPLLPGHGTNLEQMAASDYYDWLEGARHAVDYAKRRHRSTFVVGFSMGGLLALNLALEFDLDGLVIVSTPFGIHDRRGRFIKLLKHVRRYEPPCPPPPEKMAMRMGVGYSQKPLVSIEQLMALMAQTRRILPEVNVPLIGIYGARDKTAPPDDDGQVLVNTVSSPDPRLVVLPQSTHMCMFGPDRDALLRETESFITSRSSTRQKDT